MNREHIKKELINTIEQSKNMTIPKISQFMENFKKASVIIYGAGSFGKQMFNIFKEYSVDVNAFLDIKAEKGQHLFGVPVYNPEMNNLNVEQKENSLVILSIVLDQQSRNHLIKKIKSYGYDNIIYAQEIRCLFTYAEKYNLESPDYNYYRNKLNDILRCVDLWADETSAEIYKENVKSHILRDYKYCLESSEKNQYFLESINFKKGYSRFVDCGAYIGDTLNDLMLKEGKVKSIVAFEPEIDNFRRLSTYVDENSNDLADEIILYPCGVAEKTEIVNFKPLGGSSSISSSGDAHIQCIAIDDVLKAFSPTFIKMDIEGAEYGALLGAKHTIFRNRPDMAICVYHYINHLWDIPLLIKSWELGYDFYLKAHNACGMETVMYATSK